MYIEYDEYSELRKLYRQDRPLVGKLKAILGHVEREFSRAASKPGAVALKPYEVGVVKRDMLNELLRPLHLRCMDIGQVTAFVNAGNRRGIDSKPLSRFLRRARSLQRYYAASDGRAEDFYFIEHIWHALNFGIPIAVVPMCVTLHKPREADSMHQSFCKRYDELRGAIALMQYCKENGIEVPLKAIPKWKKP